MTGKRRLVVDDRYGGNHGIGRYSSEVVRRLEIPFERFAGRGDPTSLRSIVSVPRLRLGRSDLLYSPGFGCGPAAVQQILTVHDLIHLKQNNGFRSLLHRNYYDRIVKPAIIRAGHVFTVSETSAEDIRSWLHEQSVEVHVTGNGSGPQFSTQGARAQFDRPYYLYVGNLKSHKNPRTAFEAIRAFPEHELVVVTADIQSAERLARDVGISAQLRVEQGVNDTRLAELYRGSKGLLFPSLIEGFGLPALEALRCGTPVFYFAGCHSVAEIVSASGWSFPDSDDPDGLAQVMKMQAGVAPPPAPSMGWDDVAANVQTVLSHIIGQNLP